MRVVVRVCPPYDFETGTHPSNVKPNYYYESTDYQNLTIYENDARENGRNYLLDNVYGKSTSQYDLFVTEVQPLIAAALSGEDSMIVVFGNPNTGRRYTLEGPAEHPGLYYRTLDYLFSEIKNSSHHYRVMFSCFQIIKENLRDCLDVVGNSKLRMKDDIKKGIVVDNLTQTVIRTPQAGLEALATCKCEPSKCAHMVITLNVERLGFTEKRKKKVGIIKFLSMAVMDGKEEYSSKNQWMSSLLTCLRALEMKNPTIPFHKSKVSLLMRELLTGSRAGCVIASLSPQTDNLDDVLLQLELCRQIKKIVPRVEQLRRRSRTPVSKITRVRPTSEERPSRPRPVLSSLSSTGSLKYERNELKSLSNEPPGMKLRNITSPSPPPEKVISRDSSSSEISVPEPMKLKSRESSIGDLNIHEMMKQYTESSKKEITASVDRNLGLSSPYEHPEPTSVKNNILEEQKEKEYIIRIQKLEEENSQLMADKSNLQELLDQKDRKIELLEKQVQEQKSVEQPKLEKKQGNQKIVNMKDFERYREVMDATIKNMRLQIEKLENENLQLKKSFSRKEMKFRRDYKDMQQLQRELYEANERCRKLHETNEELERHAHEWESIIDELKEENHQLRLELQKRGEEVASYTKQEKQEIENMKKEIAILKNELSMYHKEGNYVLTSEQKKKHDKTLANAMAMVEKLRDELFEKVASLDEAENQLKEYEEAKTKLEAEIEKLKKEQIEKEKRFENELQIVKKALANSIVQLKKAKEQSGKQEATT